MGWVIKKYDIYEYFNESWVAITRCAADNNQYTSRCQGYFADVSNSKQHGVRFC